MISLRISSVIGHGLDDGQAAGVAGILAAIAAAAAVEGGAVEDAGVDVEVLVHLGRVGHRLFAMGADAAHEALGAGEDHRGGNQERRDAHVVEARDGARRVIAMHRAQHLVPRERGFDGDFGGLGVADFADHDDVRVLAEDGAERVGEA